MIDPYGPAGYYAFAITFGFLAFAIVGAWSLIFFSLAINLAGYIVLGTFVVYRHFQVKNKHLSSRGREYIRASEEWPGPDITKLPAAYFLYVLGSGGHSTEMALMIKHKYRGNTNMHRRYIMGAGDVFSWELERGLEAIIHDAYIMDTAGTYDSLSVTRARSVGQSYVTSVFTSLLCAFEVLVALTAVPEARPKKKYGNAFRCPHVVLTNGPGTGFIVCLVAHVLKMFYLVPQNRLKLVYIESWARVENLSLTGKLFHYTGIADLFLVQSDELAKKFGKPNIGLVAVRGPPAGLNHAQMDG
ncbi:putative glycosyltransferase family protein [Phaeoacremonium minimum UCRPA7]|uniref:UDP-N-acetylglucosamine transferase subunit ALG14 n=1 Tax=Phaeoacremonium minimum (strain UCR-PA7) TaxID=1286976 RepID=R8BW97_PHAM7|nr:putative glycosyltransferase family protein [Phaeoacremonium minimum UCRPA7]EOO03605.1 putative glycosyltransferase family protein [Phaeoacremonium minimum UCRPA7]